ncbi:tripartite tricarboxylate transporter permease [Pseudomonas aeruginosa]
MSEFDSLMQGMSLVLSAHHLGLMVIGVLLGILVGVLPGLGAPNGVALLLPLTFSMSPVSAIILLSCMYWGALFGGSITSILFNIPGEPSSVATTFDGYPMARNGQAGEALTAAFTSALLGALVGVLLLTFLSTHIARFALAFSSPEFFAVYLLAFCTFIGMSRNPPLKTLVAMTIGFAMAAVGMDTVSGDLRLTFDQPWLLSGLSFEVAVIGLFGIGEILCTVEEGLVFRGERARITPMVILRTWARLPRYWLTWLRSALVGCWMGVTPGGPTAASFMSYSLARRFSKNRENFGKGEVEGVIAPETADHSAGTSALLPMLTLGIPGSATAAVMLGGLMIWGLHPGPTLFVEQHDFVWGLIASMYLGNVVSLIVVLATVPLFASILRIPFAIVAPIIVMVCAIGAYSVHNAMLDVVLMLLFGALGYLFKKLGYPIAPLVLTAVLGDKAEDAFRQSMLFSDGQLSVFWSNPLVASLTGAALAMLLWPLLARCAGALFRRGRRSLRHAA